MTRRWKYAVLFISVLVILFLELGQFHSFTEQFIRQTQPLKPHDRRINLGIPDDHNNTKTYLCVGAGGRFGNQLFAYVSGFGIAEDRGMTVIILGIMSKIFHLSVDCYTYGEFCTKICSNIKSAAHNGSRCNMFDPSVLEINGTQSLRLSSCLRSWKYFVRHEAEIRKELQFRHLIQNAADVALRGALEGHNFGGRVVVGVHVRRGDRIHIDGLPVPDKSYYLKAMDLMRAKYRNVVFIVCSEDIPWAKANLHSPDILFVETRQFEVDFAVLSQCNHTIMSVGTFGWWAAWLANGTTIYYKNAFKPGSVNAGHTAMTDYMPPQWIAME